MAITFQDWQNIHGTTIPGRARKMQSDTIMDATFTQDIQYQVGYFYDYYHDDEPLKYTHLHSPESETKIPIDLKFIVKQKNTENKDQVGYHIQFRTTQENPIEYYNDVFVKKWNGEFPVGLYVDLADEKGVYRKWLVTERADWLGLQFPTWYVLPVDYVYQWVYRNSKGKAIKYQMCGVQRSQSSYNAGVWENYKIEIPENQRKAILPMNEISATIFYNQRFIISAPIPEPTAWRLTKVEDVSPCGVRRLTFAQDIYDQHKDYIELDNDGNVVGMYADYYVSNVLPDDYLSDAFTASPVTGKITCSGKQQIKVGGSAKTFTLTYYDEEGNISDYSPGYWQLWIDGVRVPNALVEYTEMDDPHKLKFKFLGDDSYIGKILKVKNTSDDVTSELDVEIIAL